MAVVVGQRVRIPARGPGHLAARAGAALERVGADAVAGRARHHLTDAGGGGEDRRRPRADAVAAAAARRGAAVRDRARRRPARGRPRTVHRWEMLTADHPGQRVAVSRHRLDAGRARPAARPCTAPARASSRSSSAVPSTLELDGAEHALETGDSVIFDADLAHRFRAGDEAGRDPVRRDRRPQEELVAKSTFEKIWDDHVIGDDLLFVDLHLVHEVTSPQAFDGLRLAGRRVRRPDRTLATADHNVPTIGLERGIEDELSRVQLEALAAQLRGVRRHLLRPRPPPPGHRARDRPRARRHAAGHDDRLRRLAHLHARRVRRARVRHRHQRGRARAGDADAAAAPAADAARPVRGPARPRRRREGPDPRPDRPGGDGGHDRPRRRVHRRGHPRTSRWRAG